MLGDNELLAAVNKGHEEFNAQANTTDAPDTTAAKTAIEAAATNTNTGGADTTTAAATTTDAKPFDQTEFFKQNFGTESIDEVKTRYTGYETVVGEKTALEQRLAEMEKDLPKSDLEKFFVQGMKKGITPELLSKVYNLDPEKMDAETKVKTMMAIEKPYLTQAQIDAQYKVEYGINSEAIDEVLEKDLKEGKLADAAFKAAQGLKDWTNKTMNPAPAQELEAQVKAREQAALNLQTSWKANATKLSEGVKEVSKTMPIATFDSKAGEEKQFNFKYAVPADIQQKYVDMAINEAVKANIEVTDANIGELQKYAQRIMWANEGEKITAAIANDAVSFVLQDFKARFNNTNLARTEANGSHKASTELETEVRNLVSKM